MTRRGSNANGAGGVNVTILDSDEYWRLIAQLPPDLQRWLEYEAPSPVDPRQLVTLVRQAGPYALEMLQAVFKVDSYEVWTEAGCRGVHPNALHPDELQGVFDRVKEKVARSRF